MTIKQIFSGLKFMALPGLVWNHIQASQVKQDSDSIVFKISKASGNGFDLLYL